MRTGRIASLVAAAAAFSVGLVAPVMAAVPAGFGTAIDTYKADVTSGIGLLIAAGIVVYGAKKLGQKLGLL